MPLLALHLPKKSLTKAIMCILQIISDAEVENEMKVKGEQR